MSNSIPRASVDIDTEPAPAAAKNFTVTLNKKVVYGLGIVVVMAVGALGVAYVSQDADVAAVADVPDVADDADVAERGFGMFFPRGW
jgi:hypothetical protein